MSPKHKKSPQGLESLGIKRRDVRLATRKLVVAVTRADVSGASKSDPFNCAVARAAKRCTRAHKVAVFKSRTYVQMKPQGDWVKYETPEAAARELISFDRGADFQPDNYVLRPLRKSAQPGEREKRSTSKKVTTVPIDHPKHRAAPHVLLGVRGRARI